jgi:hypothetical protein
MPRSIATKLPLLALLAAVAFGTTGMRSCGNPLFQFLNPRPAQLSLAGAMDVELTVPPHAEPGSLVVRLDGANVTGSFAGAPTRLEASLAISPGTHVLEATVDVTIRFFRIFRFDFPLATDVAFETVDLQSPGECEVLNDAECLLPYPSSRFLVPDATTQTGWRVELPAVGMPQQSGVPLSTAPYNDAKLDGFSPTVQILMHFPGGGVDTALSDAPRIDPETRTYDDRSLDADSPTVLIDANTHERILHFTERDARALASGPIADLHPFFLRPGQSLTPGHRYIVAVRRLKHPDGSDVVAEPAFAALRDRRPTDIPALADRRDHFEDVFRRLRVVGVARKDLVLAFDFVVQSDHSLTHQMLAMRDSAFTWLAQQEAASAQTFTVNPAKTIERDCAQPGVAVWREIEGTYQVPLFLSSDPVTQPLAPGTLVVDADQSPVWDGQSFTNAPFTLALPCTVLDPNGPQPYPIYLGHGLFGDGRGFVKQLARELPNLNAVAGGGSFNFLPGGTDWRGLSSPDLDSGGGSFVVGTVIAQFDNFAALPDRLRQGQLNALVLARMMKRGLFNLDPAFRTPDGRGALPGPDQEMFYAGGSLGGIMGLMFAALSPDVNNAAEIVPAINFSLLLERASPFIVFQPFLQITVSQNRIKQALALQLAHELWVRGESAGYATHVTSNPLPGTNAKNVLIAEAWLDHQVSNVATEIAARTLGVPNLVGSLTPGKVGLPDLPGPLSSAYVTYSTGALDPNNPLHTEDIPPNANLQVPAGLDADCDPHGEQAFIPAAVRQLLTFLQPGGRIENFCNGLCDADGTLLPGGLRLETSGGQTPCDPTK